MDKERILKRLKYYKPLNYNRFRWWVKWSGNNNTPLPNKSKLIDKILNGDFDPSSYLLQVRLCEEEIKEKTRSSKSIEEEIDVTRIDRLRRKRLWEDYLKDEENKLENLKKECCKHFNILPEDYDSFIEGFDGDVRGLYYALEKYIKQ